MRKVDTSLIVRLCLPQFAVGLFTTMLNNYLIYFYQPSKASGIPDLIPQGRLVLGVLTIIGMIKAVGHIIDAVTDPLIAAGSDKSKNKDGRRIPLMKKAAIPFGLCALLIFFVPLNRVSGFNAAWIAAFMWGYYFFTLYMIPHNALIPELIQDGPVRVNAYTISSFFFVTGSALGYVSPLVNKFAKKRGKKLPIILGCIVFSAAEIVICFSDMLPGNRLVLACVFALFVSFPFAVLNVLPGAMMADIIQYDTVTTGVNQEGIFGAARSFIVKMGNSLAIMIVPSLIVTGAAAGEMLGTGCTFRRLSTDEDGSCRCEAFLRCINDADLAKDLDTLRDMAAKHDVELTLRDEDNEYYRPASLTSDGYRYIKKTVEDTFPYAAAVPFILPAGTDARQFTDLSDAVIRFAPIDIDKQQYASVHGENENISVDKLHLAVDFYKALLRNYPADIR